MSHRLNRPRSRAIHYCAITVSQASQGIRITEIEHYSMVSAEPPNSMAHDRRPSSGDPVDLGTWHDDGIPATRVKSIVLCINSHGINFCVHLACNDRLARIRSMPPARDAALCIGSLLGHGHEFLQKAYRGAKAFCLKHKEGLHGNFPEIPSAGQTTPNPNLRIFFPVVKELGALTMMSVTPPAAQVRLGLPLSGKCGATRAPASR